MTLLQALTKGQYLTFLKILVSGGIFGTNSNGDNAANVLAEITSGKFSISGTLKTYVLSPDDANAADVDAERIEDATGFKAFRIIPHTPAVANLEGIIFGWSTTAGDLSAINTRMALADSALVVPDGVAISDVGVVIPAIIGATPSGGQFWSGALDWITWDGTNKIKSIAVRSSGADHVAGVIVQAIV